MREIKPKESGEEGMSEENKGAGNVMPPSGREGVKREEGVESEQLESDKAAEGGEIDEQEEPEINDKPEDSGPTV